MKQSDHDGIPPVHDLRVIVWGVILGQDIRGQELGVDLPLKQMHVIPPISDPIVDGHGMSVAEMLPSFGVYVIAAAANVAPSNAKMMFSKCALSKVRAY